jgi:hypothetical protein
MRSLQLPIFKLFFPCEQFQHGMAKVLHGTPSERLFAKTYPATLATQLGLFTSSSQAGIYFDHIHNATYQI